jgi:aminopeptidase N
MISSNLSASKKIVLLPLLALTFSVSAAPAVLQHDLTLDLRPQSGQVEIVDRIRFPEGWNSAGIVAAFYLNAAFDPVPHDSNSRLEPVPAPPGKGRLRRYRVKLSENSDTLTIGYSGKIAQADQRYALGHIGMEGVYLTGASAWYPLFDDVLVTFSMRVRAPQGWIVVSQGSDADPQSGSAVDVHFWRETRPQTDIVLLAGRFVSYTRPSADLDARVYLRNPDPALAERYLEATGHYVGFYSRLLGRYPYEKFALVENFWETGYGMPSLALLGPRVIRFPFILHSSFPHEILHNWWGNGVYVRDAGGNWSEGLTAYLADHLVQEQLGRGADHRRAALQKYASYVDVADDFPLSAFRGKHGEVSQAVGYNKALMFFHMLRQRVGDAEFLEGLRRFAARHWFEPAGYDDLRRAFETVSGLELAFEFNQWVKRTGAPWLSLSEVRVEAKGERYRVEGVIEQQQPGAPYRLRVPVALQLEGRAKAVRKVVTIEAKRQRFELELASRPIDLHLDPEFDLFRRLAPGEAPASLGDLLGAKNPVFIMPARETSAVSAAYERLARALGSASTLDDTGGVPLRRSVWLLGWDNAHLDTLANALGAEGLVFTSEGLSLGADFYDRGKVCAVVAARKADEAKKSIGFIGCDNPKALTVLARKIPHYSKYGFLVFSGDQADNLRKDEWPVRDSPMSVVFDARRARFPPPMPPRRPLSGAP